MWTPAELKEVRQNLLTQLRDLKRNHASLQSEVVQSLGGEVGGLQPEIPSQGADLSQRLAEEEVAMSVLNVETKLHKEITDAIERIDQNRYGFCKQCGKRIIKDRLRAVPHAQHCIACAQHES